jgi:hypothetical protein
MAEIEIPYTPRGLQLKAHNRKERFAILVCHRRFGKTVYAINEMLKGAVTCTLPEPRFAYIAPLYRQAKAVAWDMLKYYTRPIPEMKYNEAELRADMPTGARISLFGGDNPDSLRGIYLDGVVLDEYAQMSERLWPEVIRPALADRKGWAVFIGTPQGHNDFHRLYETYLDDDDWYCRIHRASETKYVDEDELAAARKQMSEEQYAQEFECSWTAAITGAYYGKLLEDAGEQQRIGRVQHDPALMVETWWDLGIGDPTAIWFVQRNGPEIRLIDFYQATGEPLSHYVRVLEEKAKEGEWKYEAHVFPHDVRQRSLDTGRSRVEALRNLGIDPEIVVQHRIEDGIEAARRMLPNCWFDELHCRAGIDALRQYRTSYDDKLKTYRLRPVHDWTSHAADAFRYGAMYVPVSQGWEPLAYENAGIV